jgi:hypothetical protein
MLKPGSASIRRSASHCKPSAAWILTFVRMTEEKHPGTANENGAPYGTPFRDAEAEGSDQFE